MRLLASSREFIIVPAGLLAARPLTGPVAVAFMPDNGTEPGDGDWLRAGWVAYPDGTPIGAGLLAGPEPGLSWPAATMRYSSASGCRTARCAPGAGRGSASGWNRPRPRRCRPLPPWRAPARHAARHGRLAAFRRR